MVVHPDSFRFVPPGPGPQASSRSRTRPASHGRSQPDRCSSADSRPAVKPQTIRPAASKAGPVCPLGPRTVNRFAGSVRTATGTRTTRATSAASTTRTGDGDAQCASTGVTRKPVGGMNRSGRAASGTTPDGSSPVSSRASRRAACTGPVSVGSSLPPGKATCPACERSVAARSVSSTSGPPDSASVNSISTEARRGSPLSGGRRRHPNQAGSRPSAPSTSGRSDAGVAEGAGSGTRGMSACAVTGTAPRRPRRRRRSGTGRAGPPSRRRRPRGSRS